MKNSEYDQYELDMTLIHALKHPNHILYDDREKGRQWIYDDRPFNKKKIPQTLKKCSVAELIKLGANINEARQYVVEDRISRHSASIDTTVRKSTPLEFAILSGSLANVIILLKNGAAIDLNYALELAQAKNQPFIAEYLASKGAVSKTSRQNIADTKIPSAPPISDQETTSPAEAIPILEETQSSSFISRISQFFSAAKKASRNYDVGGSQSLEEIADPATNFMSDEQAIEKQRILGELAYQASKRSSLTAFYRDQNTGKTYSYPLLKILELGANTNYIPQDSKTQSSMLMNLITETYDNDALYLENAACISMLIHKNSDVNHRNKNDETALSRSLFHLNHIFLSNEAKKDQRNLIAYGKKRANLTLFLMASGAMATASDLTYLIERLDYSLNTEDAHKMEIVEVLKTMIQNRANVNEDLGNGNIFDLIYQHRNRFSPFTDRKNRNLIRLVAREAILNGEEITGIENKAYKKIIEREQEYCKSLTNNQDEESVASKASAPPLPQAAPEYTSPTSFAVSTSALETKLDQVSTGALPQATAHTIQIAATVAPEVTSNKTSIFGRIGKAVSNARQFISKPFTHRQFDHSEMPTKSITSSAPFLEEDTALREASIKKIELNQPSAPEIIQETEIGHKKIGIFPIVEEEKSTDEEEKQEEKSDDATVNYSLNYLLPKPPSHQPKTPQTQTQPVSVTPANNSQEKVLTHS